MTNLKISIKGTYLPAIGGISTHLSRLARKLNAEEILHYVYSTNSLNGYHDENIKLIDVSYIKLRYGVFKSLLWVFRHGITDHSKCFHFHGHPIWESPTLFLMLLFKKNIVYTIHDQMMLAEIDNLPKSLVLLFKNIIKNKCIYWIAVNVNIQEQLIKLEPNVKNISVIPAFIPAISTNEPLNHEIEIFLKSKSHTISIYAHSTRLFEGKDLYGIDLAIKSLAKVRETFPKVGLVISIPGDIIDDQINKYQKLIFNLQLTDNVLLMFQPVNNPMNLWKRSNIVLRPTLTDGDSLVVREALSQNTHLIASDVVSRPEGTILFKSEDINDLYLKIVETLNTNESKATNISSPDNYELIKSVYNSFDK
ncbi:hypothetical protein [Mariniphaga sp.]|uniref:hypothetical protein n=1 Tax=Mariniphaga sp. TaxID=1954475 RepID=UPI00356AE598